MHKMISQLEHVVEGKIYNFVCAHDAPIAHIRESLCKFLSYVEQVENAAKAAQAKAEAQKQVEPPAEPKTDEVKA